MKYPTTPFMLRGVLAIGLGVMTTFFLSTGCAEGARSAQDGTALDTDAATALRADALLIQRMRNATDQEVRAYIREVVALELPADYPIPASIIEAGDPKSAAADIAARYPEFNGRRDAALVDAVRENPVRYREVVLESRAMRQVYKDHESVRRN
ncbi:MAG: hypothetical protein RBT71_14145 [Flavobacteriales bacterium]|jgi:hypothetical protein|nr:hypothetical protein [Flavobacteriales bacterium]